MATAQAPGEPTLSQATPAQVADALAQPGIVLDLGALAVRIRSRVRALAVALRAVYPDFPLDTTSGWCDTTVELRSAGGLRRWVRPLGTIEVDGVDPFGPFPLDQLLPHFEWGVNWASANMLNSHLLLHAGTVEVAGHGVLMVANPGSGKSTLTAALAGRGARLLSDEFGVVRIADLALRAMVKPIALKNSSIEAIRRWSPDARFGPIYPNTRKGVLVHHAVPAASVARRRETARPSLVIFPQWRESSPVELDPVAQARAFMELAANSFNYEVMGPVGFDAVARLLERVRCYRLQYGRLEEAIDAIHRLCEPTQAAFESTEAAEGAA
ncbi:MAG: HprK-related kinase A [Burkholderiaceae bacterium]